MGRQIVPDGCGIDEFVHGVDANRPRERAVACDEVELQEIAVKDRVARGPYWA
jgi:hypothetical protein